MEEKRSADGASSMVSGKKQGSSKRDSEVAATVVGGHQENGTTRAKGRKDFQGKRE